jgi:hypothetical protein
MMSKFFTDSRNHTSFSLEHVVKFDKSVTITGIQPKFRILPNIEVTLITDGIEVETRILFYEGEEELRNAEFIRLRNELNDWFR